MRAGLGQRVVGGRDGVEQPRQVDLAVRGGHDECRPAEPSLRAVEGRLRRDRGLGPAVVLGSGLPLGARRGVECGPGGAEVGRGDVTRQRRDALLADRAVIADVQGLRETGRGVGALGCVEGVAGEGER